MSRREGATGPPQRPRSPRELAAGLVLTFAVAVFDAAPFLRSALSMYDGGLQLTLARFIGTERLPYRDLWTLYGPGPPFLTSVVMDVFGRGITPFRATIVLVHVLAAVGVYLVLRRFLAWPWALAFAATMAAFGDGVPYHFHQTLLFIVWAVWFVLRADDDPARAPRRLVIAAGLFGLSFWGRYEFAAVAAGLVVVLWWFFRDRVSPSAARAILAVGFAGPAAFLVYLLLVVGPDRAWLNLVEYPLVRYPDHLCRGLPDAWREAAGALVAPLRGDWWTADDFILWSGTFVAPVLAVLCLVVGFRRRRDDPFFGYAAVAIGVVSLVVWLEHRPRYSAYPIPLLPLVLVSAAMLLGHLARRRPRSSRAVSAVVSIVLVSALATSWFGETAAAWRGWPAHHPLFGFARGEVNGYYDPAAWVGVVREVQARTGPDDEILVALTDNRRHWANAPLFYWLADRPPSTRFFEFNPCLTDTAVVQEEIVRELQHVDVVVATTFFRGATTSARGPGPTVLDRYLETNYDVVHTTDLPLDQGAVVLARPAAPQD